MTKAMHSNIPNLIMMVRPKHFGFNNQTAASNAFQQEIADKGLLEKAVREFDNMHETLLSKDIVVKVFEDQDSILPDAVFPNNWISHIPDGPLIIYPMLTPNRRAEVRPDIIDWCNKTFHPTSIIDLTGNVEEGIFLEGTGSIVFDHDSKIAFACESVRTNLDLLSTLCKQIGYRVISFESLDLKGNQIYHTNVMMSVSKHVSIICLDSIENNLERMMVKESIQKTGKELLTLSRKQINAFAGNMFEVQNTSGKSFYLMSQTACEALEQGQIDVISRHAEILPLSIPTIEQVGGGSVRCMLAGMFL